MSYAEALQTTEPSVGATESIVGFVDALRYDALSDEVRHYAKRHLLDTVGVMIAGAEGDVASHAEAVLAGVRAPGSVPPSWAAPPRTASSSTTAIATARRIAAASWCRQRWPLPMAAAPTARRC